MNRVDTNGNGNNNKKKGTHALEKLENESKTSGTITTKAKANKFPFRINLKNSKAMGSRRHGRPKKSKNSSTPEYNDANTIDLVADDTGKAQKSAKHGKKKETGSDYTPLVYTASDTKSTEVDNESSEHGSPPWEGEDISQLPQHKSPPDKKESSPDHQMNLNGQSDIILQYGIYRSDNEKQESDNNFSGQDEEVSDGDGLEQHKQVSDGDGLEQHKQVSDGDRLEQHKQVSDGDGLEQHKQVSDGTDGDGLEQHKQVSDGNGSDQDEQVSDGNGSDQDEQVSDGNGTDQDEEVSDGDESDQDEQVSDQDEEVSDGDGSGGENDESSDEKSQQRYVSSKCLSPKLVAAVMFTDSRNSEDVVTVDTGKGNDSISFIYSPTASEINGFGKSEFDIDGILGNLTTDTPNCINIEADGRIDVV